VQNLEEFGFVHQKKQLGEDWFSIRTKIAPEILDKKLTEICNVIRQLRFIGLDDKSIAEIVKNKLYPNNFTIAGLNLNLFHDETVHRLVISGLYAFVNYLVLNDEPGGASQRAVPRLEIAFLDLVKSMTARGIDLKEIGIGELCPQSP
jgi:hypothetical protein